MASRRIEQEVFNCLDNNISFILDAGAGSGKTWTLVQALKYLIDKYSTKFKRTNQKIVCITYTNNAKNEIIERIESNKLVIVSTIHDFLWECIHQYKKELRIKFIEILEERISKENAELASAKNKETQKYKKTLEKRDKLQEEKDSLVNNNENIKYREYASYKDGVISHDDLLELAHKIFSFYKMINRIIRDSFPAIFVDEYQDTNIQVVKILCEHLNVDSNNFLLGFFGDKMQKIYDEGIGEISSSYNLKLLKKEENYRCSQNVINLLNKIRNDIEQYPSGKNKQVDGSISFYYMGEQSEFNVNLFITNNLSDEWINPNNTTKILYLTHRFIARENGYLEIFNLYNSSQNPPYRKVACLTDNKNSRSCPFANFLFDIENINNLYSTNQIQLLLQKIKDLPFNSFDDRRKIRETLNKLRELSLNNTIKEVIDFVVAENVLPKSEKIESYNYEEANNQAFYDDLMALEYKQFSSLYQVQEEQTPFSTKHGTKGSEFNNVLVVIDDNAWHNYNFDRYFSQTETNENIKLRTTNLFYVVCSRAKVNLAVICLSNLSEKSLENIKQMFGEVKLIS